MDATGTGTGGGAYPPGSHHNYARGGSISGMSRASGGFMRREPSYEDDDNSTRFYARWADGFKRADGSQRSPSKGGHMDDMSFVDHHHSNQLQPMLSRGSEADYYDVRTANMQTAHSLLARKLKGRHLQMIAIGGSIGTGLFVASGRALEAGGPASMLIAYSFIGCMLYCTVQALGELAVAFPVAGSFSSYSTRFLHPSWGFAMGWK